MESHEADLDRAKQYIQYIIKVHGGHDFDAFFGECRCGVVMEYWKNAMSYRLDQLDGSSISPRPYHCATCRYSEV